MALTKTKTTDIYTNVDHWKIPMGHGCCFSPCIEGNTISIIYCKTCLSGHLSIMDTFESPKLLAISLHCPIIAHSGHLANVDNRQGIWTQPFIVLQVNLAEPPLIPTNFTKYVAILCHTICIIVVKKHNKCAPNKASLLPSRSLGHCQMFKLSPLGFSWTSKPFELVFP